MAQKHDHVRRLQKKVIEISLIESRRKAVINTNNVLVMLP